MEQICTNQTKIYPVLCEHVYNLTIAQLWKDFHKNFTQVKRKSGSAWIPFNTPRGFNKH